MVASTRITGIGLRVCMDNTPCGSLGDWMLDRVFSLWHIHRIMLVQFRAGHTLEERRETLCKRE